MRQVPRVYREFIRVYERLTRGLCVVYQKTRFATIVYPDGFSKAIGRIMLRERMGA